ncbi:zinc finger protein 618-like [Haemaphysalis longicornis]
MLKSVCSQFEEIEGLLESRNNPIMESVNKSTLNDLIEFLQPFKDASDALEEEKRPTLPLVVLYASALRKHLEAAPVSAVEIEKLKARARHFLKTKLKISLLHKTATFLWPQFRQLRMLPEDERLEVYAHVRELLARITEAMSQGGEDETNNDVREPASKRRCLGLFLDWCDEEDDKTPKDEMEEYLYGKKEYSCSGVSELCDFWREHEKEFPKLALLSKRILCIPATSASSERNFSAAGYIMQARRTCLKKESMDNLLFLHKNM